MRTLRRITAIAVVLGLLVGTAALTNAEAGGPAEAALQHVSKRDNVPLARLAVDAIAQVSFPYTQRAIWDVKVRDTGTGQMMGAHVDERLRAFDSNEALLQAEAEARAVALGKRTEALDALLGSVGPEERVEVAVWLKGIPPPEDRSAAELSDAVIAAMLTQARASYAAVEAPFLEFARTNGWEIVYAAQYAPLVFVKVPVADVGFVESFDDVVSVDRTHVGAPELSSAGPTVLAPPVWARGITGTGKRVAVVEGGGVQFANPHLPAGGLYYRSGSPNIDEHTTAVAGIIQSTHATHRGIAPGSLGVLSANARSYSTSAIIAATEWAVTNGARIISNSWGVDTDLSMNALDRYVDHLVWHHWVTVVKSAGNNAGGYGTGTGHVTSPGLGYNVLTVGAFDDAGDSWWLNDALAPYSSYRDPKSSHGDREKPEVAAVGTSVVSTTVSSPWIANAGSGTSFAAPQVSGQAALMMQRASWLQVWPEVVRAVIMATATHNIEGASRLSEYDGAGGINVDKSDETMTLGRTGRWGLTKSMTPLKHLFAVPQEGRVRLAIAWDSQPNNGHPPLSDPLRADLDLYVYGPSGGLLASSLSWDNPYEIVEFDARTPGVYEARVHAFRFDGTHEWLGLGWTLV